MSQGRDWSGTQRAGYTRWLRWMGSVLAVVGVVLVIWPGGPEAVLAAVLCLGVGLLIAFAALVFGSVRLVLDEGGVHARLGPWGRPRMELAWSEVTGVELVDARARQWGGWGLRWNPRRHGTAILLNQGPAVLFSRIDGTVLLVTIDDAAAAAAAAMGWLPAR